MEASVNIPYWKVWQLHARDLSFEEQIHAQKPSVHAHGCGHCLEMASQ